MAYMFTNSFTLSIARGVVTDRVMGSFLFREDRKRNGSILCKPGAGYLMNHKPILEIGSRVESRNDMSMPALETINR